MSERITIDTLKQQRDGHLEYGKVQSKDHAWVRPVFPTVGYYLDDEGKPVGRLVSCGGGPRSGHLQYGKHTDRYVSVEELTLAANRSETPATI